MAYRHAARGLAAAYQTEAVVKQESLAVHAARGLIGAGIPGGAADIDKVVALLVERGISFRGEEVRLVVGHWKDELSITNTAQVRLEQDLLARAHTAARDRFKALGRDALATAIGATGMAYTAEQLAAIRTLEHVGALPLLTGVAGAGRTTIMAPRPSRPWPISATCCSRCRSRRQLPGLAVSSAQRSPALPEVPSMAEVGFRDIDVNSWVSVHAPARLPPDITARLEQATTAALVDPIVIAKLREQGGAPGRLSPAAFAHEIATDSARWRQVVAVAGLRIDG